VWLDDRAFGALRHGMEDDVVGIADALSRRVVIRVAPPAAALACPACAHELTATEVSGVQVDFCAAHGTWLDPRSVEAIALASQDARGETENDDEWVERISGSFHAVPVGLLEALGTVIAVGDHRRRLRR
jgi:Zn-finger nucleic acid-binding protein